MTLTNFPNGIAVNGYEVLPSNYFTVSVDFSSATWNTVAAHEIATVTGLARVMIAAVVTTLGAGATATVALGWDGSTSGIIGATTITDLIVGELWYDTTPTTTGDTFANVVKDFAIYSKDIGITIATAAATGGVIVFHVWWLPLSVEATVAAGTGGAFS
jgi:hypothetical protein